MKKLDPKLMHPRDQIVRIMDKIYRNGLTTLSGGNISIMDESGDMWVSPAGIDKGRLKPSDIMCVHKDGSIEGPHRPSSEYPFHRAIYSCRPDIKAVIHAHPPGLVSFSIIRQTPDTSVIPQAREVCGPVGYALYELPGSDQLGDIIAGEFQKGFSSVIMENHGTVVGGSDLLDAYARFETLEFTCRTIIYADQIGTPHALSDAQIDAFEKQIPALLPEMEKVEHPSDERAIRQEIVDIVHRACDQGMMISSYGTVSCRWKDNDFVITPTGMARWDLEEKDLVQICKGQREAGKIPSRSAWLHQEIYKKYPFINSIILTQSPYLMAYGVSHEALDVRTIPESWIFLQDIPNLPFGSQFFGETQLIDTLSETTPVILVNNDSVLVTGDKLLSVFDRLEVAELSAKSLTMGASRGNLVPINDDQIEDLRQKFLC